MPHILWKVCSINIFKSTNYWWACYFHREAWNFPGLSFTALLKTTCLPVRLAHSGWLMCTSPTILPCSFTGSCQCLHYSLREPGPRQLQQSAAIARVLLCCFCNRDGKSFSHNPPKGLESKGTSLWEVWTAQYPRPNLNPGHFRILLKITPNTLFIMYGAFIF